MTRKEKRLLDIIASALAFDGVPPSFDEMRERLGLKSKSGIHRRLGQLEEKDYIDRVHHRTRAIELTQKGRDYMELHPAEELQREGEAITPAQWALAGIASFVVLVFVGTVIGLIARIIINL